MDHMAGLKGAYINQAFGNTLEGIRVIDILKSPLSQELYIKHVLRTIFLESLDKRS